MNASEALAELERRGTRRGVEGLARYGIQAEHALGVPMHALLKLRKQIGQDHALARALWDSGCYDARLLAALVGEPQQVTRRQMDAWARGFENWGDCDTVCFHLFDKTPHAWPKALQWARSPREFVRRGGFVLMACLALHDKAAPDARFLPFLASIEQGACDERNFVKKGVSWALRAIGRRSLGLHAPALALARRLGSSEDAACRWVGKEALRELSSPKVRAQMARRAERAPRARPRPGSP